VNKDDDEAWKLRLSKVIKAKFDEGKIDDRLHDIALKAKEIIEVRDNDPTNDIDENTRKYG